MGTGRYFIFTNLWHVNLFIQTETPAITDKSVLP